MDGLDEVVVAAGDDPRRAVERIDALAGDEDDRQIRVGVIAQLAADAVAAAPGHDDIEDGRVEAPLACGRGRLVGAPRRHDAVTGTFEQVHEKPDEALVVVDD